MLNELLSRYPNLSSCKEDLKNAAEALIKCYESGGKLMICGNGGSCADSDHIVGELMKGFLKKRPLTDEKKAEMKKNCPELDNEILNKLQYGLPAVALTTLNAVNTAFCNDVDPNLIFAQDVMALGKKGDVLISISTSGNSVNGNAAAKVAKALGITVIALTGAKGGKLNEVADICIKVPETETFKVQELHLPVYHYLCAATEEHFYKA